MFVLGVFSLLFGYFQTGGKNKVMLPKRRMECGVIEGKLLTFRNRACCNNVKSLVAGVCIATMVLWCPIGRVFIPKNKDVFAYRVGVLAEIQFLSLIPVVFNKALGNYALRL